jgi:hypothetical protein
MIILFLILIENFIINFLIIMTIYFKSQSYINLLDLKKINFILIQSLLGIAKYTLNMI